jgi:hypothetical protein
MAIKNSWSAGEVLLAADLTDTVVDKVSKAPSSSQTITSGTATTKPLIIKAAAGQTANLLEFQNSGGTAIAAIAADGQYLGGQARNLLYNGAMQVAQRATSVASITTSGYYTADRFSLDLASLGTWTQSVENDAPAGSGLRKSVKMLCTTADAAPAASDRVNVFQSLEGQDLQRIAKGTASAQQLTLSFWVKSNVTGTYTVLVYDADNARATSFAYSISASATWEKKTILIPADTAGALDNDNAASLNIHWQIGAGSNSTSGTLMSTWASYVEANRAVGQTNLAAAINNYWQITGVQLEVGPVATSFEFKPFGQELRECQRYYQIINGGNGWNPLTTLARFLFPLSPRLRANPTAITLTQAGTYNHPGGNGTPTALTLNTSLPAGAFVDADVTGLTANQIGTLYNAIYGISAEL